MAARTLDMPMWEGGQRMMLTAAPDAFSNIAAGDRIVTANREVLEACRKRADLAREAVRCTVNVSPSKDLQRKVVRRFGEASKQKAPDPSSEW